jgi:enoyl-CoA hydratase/carnithine racemase
MKMMQRMTLGDVLRMSLLGAHEVIGAETAERIGLVSEVVAPEDLLDSAMALAEIIASQPAAAVQTTLRAVWAAVEATPHQALRLAPAILANGTSAAALAEGQATFASGKRVQRRVR